MSETFKTENKYLKTYLKHALRYNMLKVYIIEATKFYTDLKAKKLP